MVHTSVNSEFWRLRYEDHKFKASLGFIVRPCLKTTAKAFMFFRYSSSFALSYNL
jgi:hypothetical protein